MTRLLSFARTEMCNVSGHARYTTQIIKMFKDTFLQQILFSPKPILYRIFHPYILKILSYLQFDCLKVLGLSPCLHLCLKKSTVKVREVVLSNTLQIFQNIWFLSGWWDYAITRKPISGSFWSLPNNLYAYIQNQIRN